MSKELLRRAYVALINAHATLMGSKYTFDQNFSATVLDEIKAELAKPDPKPIAWANISNGVIHGLSQHPEDQEKWINRTPLYASTQNIDPELKSVAIALRDYIDAIPDYLADQFPAMPGVDRDWVNDVIDGTDKTEHLHAKIALIKDAVINCFGKNAVACDGVLMVTVNHYNKLVEVINSTKD